MQDNLLSRHQALGSFAAAVAAQALLARAESEAYPAKSIRWLVGYPPGGDSDTIARIVGEAMGKRLNQTFVFENRPGDSADIAGVVLEICIDYSTCSQHVRAGNMRPPPVASVKRLSGLPGCDEYAWQGRVAQPARPTLLWTSSMSR